MSCTKTQRKLCGECETCLNRSFAKEKNAQKVLCWSPKNKVDPKFITCSSNKKFWFNCECGHEFDSTLNNIKSGSWCPYCAKIPKKLCDDDDCKQCYKRSFAKEKDKAKYWSERNEKTPRQVFRTDNRKYEFNCDCGHTFSMSPGKIVKMKRWCPYCGNQKLCDNNDCVTCYEKSFEFILSKGTEYEWHIKNKPLTPRDVFTQTHKEYWFICNKGHNFQAELRGLSRGRGCPFCVNKTACKLKEFIEKTYKVSTEHRFIWCKNTENDYDLPFDFYILEKNVLIELDGAQHFRQVMDWKDPDSTRYNDVFKMKQALDNGIRIIRLLQEDVANNKNNVWQKRLIEAIESDEQVTYITCKEKDKDIYECHQEELEYELKET